MQIVKLQQKFSIGKIIVYDLFSLLQNIYISLFGNDILQLDDWKEIWWKMGKNSMQYIIVFHVEAFQCEGALSRGENPSLFFNIIHPKAWAAAENILPQNRVTFNEIKLIWLVETIKVHVSNEICADKIAGCILVG